MVPGDIFSRLAQERIIFLYEEIDASIATSISATMMLMDIDDSVKPITLYINSRGGTIEDGLLTIYDTLQYIKSPVKTVCIGEAYSSAAVILSAGTKGFRFAYPNARIMIHNIQIEEMSGTQKEIQDEAKRTKELNSTMMKITAKHTGQVLKKVSRDCNKDKYFTAEAAVKYGLIDHVIIPAKNA